MTEQRHRRWRLGMSTLVAALAVGTLTAPAWSATAAVPTGYSFDGWPTVGTVLTNGTAPSKHDCTGSVIDSPHGNVILTAAHCVEPKKGVFARSVQFYPGYHDGPNRTWGSYTSESMVYQGNTIAKVVVPVEYDPTAKSPDKYSSSPYDYAFVILKPSGGKNVAQRTGSLHLVTNARIGNTPTTIAGYPARAARPMRCSNVTNYGNPHSYIRMDCYGYPNGGHQGIGLPGGTSGSPWLLGDANHVSHNVIGTMGGYDRGGDHAHHGENYSVYFNSRTGQYYEQAKRMG
ncbi:trypsin-like serine protease [Kutzneria buriramensis]|uniref:Trypsin n=1 Tax=Kutzneria buriramensis TaxID=1045776 RepID=A0A3E0GXJ1_9PSEU|nr:trypsin-like serine protease [Kutzneria buriramensis]REH29620.1 trypsin [Kutzneria buriramensis]